MKIEAGTITLELQEQRALGFAPDVTQWPQDDALALRDHALFMRDMWRGVSVAEDNPVFGTVHSRAIWAHYAAMLMNSMAEGNATAALVVDTPSDINGSFTAPAEVPLDVRPLSLIDRG